MLLNRSSAMIYCRELKPSHNSFDVNLQRKQADGMFVLGFHATVRHKYYSMRYFLIVIEEEINEAHKGGSLIDDAEPEGSLLGRAFIRIYQLEELENDIIHTRCDWLKDILVLLGENADALRTTEYCLTSLHPASCAGKYTFRIF